MCWKNTQAHLRRPPGAPFNFSYDQRSVGSLERAVWHPKIGVLLLAKIGAGGKPPVGDSLRTLVSYETSLLIEFVRNNRLRARSVGNQLCFKTPPGMVYEKFV